MSSGTDVPAPRVLRLARPRPMPPAPRAVTSTLGRFPRTALVLCLVLIVVGIAWLFATQRSAEQDSADRDVAIGGLVGDVNALRTAVATLGGDPDTVAPSPDARLSEAGVTGPAGPRGEAGASGAAGTDGVPGARGPSGPSGPSGGPGPSGASGAAGASGVAGSNGPQGSPGASGVGGVDGSAGAAGSAGPAGPQGEPGVAGPAGPVGAAGADGRSLVGADCVGSGVESSWVLSYSDGTTSTVSGPCRLEQSPSGEPTTTPPIETTDPAPPDTTDPEVP